jgi:hypothetical protein
MTATVLFIGTSQAEEGDSVLSEWLPASDAVDTGDPVNGVDDDDDGTTGDDGDETDSGGEIVDGELDSAATVSVSHNSPINFRMVSAGDYYGTVAYSYSSSSGWIEVDQEQCQEDICDIGGEMDEESAGSYLMAGLFISEQADIFGEEVEAAIGDTDISDAKTLNTEKVGESTIVCIPVEEGACES